MFKFLVAILNNFMLTLSWCKVTYYTRETLAPMSEPLSSTYTLLAITFHALTLLSLPHFCAKIRNKTDIAKRFLKNICSNASF